jgi:ATP-dependent RNA helicase DeaD
MEIEHTYMQFTALDIQPNILGALNEMGYDDMTPIQACAIPPILAGQDVLGLAETGSGKTAACGIPLVQGIRPDVEAIQALVLVPTRELAMQYALELDHIAQFTDVVPFAVFGGVSMAVQKIKLRHKVDILVATPGRLIDFIWNTDLSLSQVRTVVLDEADEMLKMGFIEDVDFIMSCLVHEHQTLLFSATMSKDIDRLARAYLKQPVRLELNRLQKAPQSLQHHFQYTGRHRLSALIAYLQNEDIEQSIIFCNTRLHGAQLYRELRGTIPSLEFMHGGLDQERRTSIFNQFRRKQIRVMIATDVAARGLDFTHVSHVINYDAPLSHDIYTHRTGRTGRMGRTGIALTLVTDRDLKELPTLLQRNRIEPVWRGPAPELAPTPKRRPSARKRKSAAPRPARRRKRQTSSASLP